MLQPVLMINGYLISILGFTMLLPAIVDVYYKHGHWSSFLTSAIILIFLGVCLFLSNRTKIKKVTIQQGFLITVVSWFSITLLASLPFVLSGVIPSFADALFESASGVSATGATILTNIDNTSKAVLLWRSLLNGLGGIGIVIFAVALLPFLGIGGMQVFTRESTDINDKVLPRFSYLAKEIILIYLSIVILCCVSLYYAGMDWFDAINHALSAVSTAGFSTHDASVAYFNSPTIEAVLMLFMVLGALPMTLYILLLQRKEIDNIRSSQAITFLKILFIYTTAMVLWLLFTKQYSFLEALRFASFNIVSNVTTTGFSSVDYVQWGTLSSILFFIFALTGGCTGSTTGSIKIFRWQVVFAFLKRSMAVSVDPNRIAPTKIGNVTLSNSVIISVFTFLTAYVLSIAVLTIIISLTGLNFEESISAVVACITNTGPGINAIIGPNGNYSSLSDFAKYVLSFSMLLGRLEILTVIVIFTRTFWHR